jgi:putative ABC transport system permease protein
MPLLYAEKKIDDNSNSWEWYFRTYSFALVKDGKHQYDLQAALNDLVAQKYKDLKSEQVKDFKLSAQPLGDIQLELKGNDTNTRLPSMGYYILGGLAIVVMLSACLNYTNLSIARALTRAKEIGVRKITGANRKSIILQFLSESILTSLFAMCMGYILLIVIRRSFTSLWINRYLNFELPDSPTIYVAFIFFAVIIGIIAGLYPAFRLSAYQPVKALKALTSVRSGKFRMYKVLSVTQFVISLLFITTSILIFNQFRHYMGFDYGFSSKNIINLELQGNDYAKLANEMESVPGVWWRPPGRITATTSVSQERVMISLNFFQF